MKAITKVNGKVLTVATYVCTGPKEDFAEELLEAEFLKQAKTKYSCISTFTDKKNCIFELKKKDEENSYEYTIEI